MKKKITVILIFICAIALFMVAYLTSQKRHAFPLNADNAVGNTAGNLYNGGYFCENDGFVYFSNPYDNYALYRMTPDETDMEKLITTETKCINVMGDYIYYYQFGSGSGEGFGYVIDMNGVYRSPKKSPKTGSCLDKIHLDTMLLYGNHLYYDANDSTGVYLKRLSINGNDSENLTNYKLTAVCCADNGKLYFNNTTDNYRLQSFDVNTKRISDELISDVYQPIVEGNTAYCIDIHNHYALVKYDLMTGEKTVLDDSTRVDMFNMSDKYIYYQTSGDVIEFRRIPKNGGTYEVIAEGAYNTFQITSKYVYFRQFNSEVPIYRIPLDGSLDITTFDAARNAAAENIK